MPLVGKLSVVKLYPFEGGASLYRCDHNRNSTGCLVPLCDGVAYNAVPIKKNYGAILHDRARTTAAVHRAIQHSQESQIKLAEQVHQRLITNGPGGTPRAKHNAPRPGTIRF